MSDFTTKKYVVQAGDTLYRIADKYGVTIKDILEVNPEINNPNQIFVGQVIFIPLKAVSRRKCSVILKTPEYLRPVADITGGVAFVQALDKGYGVTFTATGLPEPESIGNNFDSYIGEVRLEDEFYFIILQEATYSNQLSTWSGTRPIIEELFAVETRLAVMPYSLEEDIRTNPRLIGTIRECRS